MISEYFVKRFGLTKDGSDNLVKGIAYTALINIAFMFPVGLYALLIYMWVEPLPAVKSSSRTLECSSY